MTYFPHAFGLVGALGVAYVPSVGLAGVLGVCGVSRVLFFARRNL